MFKENAEFTVVSDKKKGIKAFISVNSRIRGKACGGLRITGDVSEKEIAEMSRTMTLKYGFLGIPMGGAKAGIRTSFAPGSRERNEAMQYVGRKLSGMLKNREFIPGFDMGTEFSDIQALLHGAGMQARPGDWRKITHIYTAWTMLAAAREALRARGQSFEGKSIVVEGLGNVGSEFAFQAQKEGAKIIAFSNALGAVFEEKGLDAAELRSLFLEKGDAFINSYKKGERIHPPLPASIISLKSDVLAACARFSPIDERNAESVGAAIVCAAHNMNLGCNARKALEKKGVTYIPGFIANSGGVLGARLCEFFDDNEIRSIIDTAFSARVRDCLLIARRNNASVEDIGTAIAVKTFGKVKKIEENKGFLERAAAFAIGQLPKPLKKKFYRRKLSQLDFC